MSNPLETGKRSTSAMRPTHSATAVLVVSEASAEAAALAALLQGGQYTVVMAQSLRDASAELVEREFAAIVCSLAGVGQTQLQAAFELRSHRANAGTPLLLLTPEGTEHASVMRIVGGGVGFVDCVDHPADEFVLRTKIRMYVDMFRSRQRLREMDAQGSALLMDSLTGLPNQVLFVDRTDQAMRQAARSGGRVAVAVMDLEQIREVKETLGPMTGDELLRLIALRLSGALRRSDTVARIRDTAFGIVLACDTRDGVQTVTARLERVMSDAFAVGGHRITLGGGIGVAMFPEHGREPRVLIERATTVMVIAKQNSMGHLFYDPIEHAGSDDTADTAAEMNAEELLKVSAA